MRAKGSDICALCRAPLQSALDLIYEGTFLLVRGEKQKQSGNTEAASALFKRSAAKFHRGLEVDPRNIIAQLNLGGLYMKGEGIAQNAKKAMKWTLKAAQQGNAEAQYNVARLYEDGGKGVPKNSAEAERFHRKSAFQGYHGAQYVLGRLCSSWHEGKCNFLRSDGSMCDDVEAMRWFRLSAEQAFAPAQLALGELYFFGVGVKRDPMEAVKWMRRSAENGYPTAQFLLGYTYDSGIRLPQDCLEAVRWFQKAALQGEDRACCILLQRVQICIRYV